MPVYISYLKHIIICLFLSLITTFAVADEFVINEQDTLINLDKGLWVLEDPLHVLTPHEVLASERFLFNTAKVPNLGVSASTFWIKFTIKNESSHSKLLLKLAYPNMDYVALYTPTQPDNITIQEMGQYQPFSKRKYPFIDYLFDINIKKGESKTFLIKIKSGEQMMVPITLGTLESILSKSSDSELLFGIYSGFILVMLLYNLFIFITVRDHNYLYYVVYLITIGLAQIDIMGFGFKYLWPISSYLAIHNIYFLSSSVMFSLSSFIIKFLNTKDEVPILHKILIGINGIYVAVVLLALIGKHQDAYKGIQLGGTIVAIFFPYLAMRLIRKGNKSATFFLIAWLVFLLGVFLFALKDFGVLPYNVFTVYTMPFGSAMEVVLLSFALASRINTLKQEKEEAQRKELVALEENERIIRDQNIILEQEVEARTRELHEANQALNTTLQDLKEAQLKIVEAEKMASLGQLTAGVAHEINNPVNFIKSNIRPLKRDIAALNQLINYYESIATPEEFAAKLVEIKAFKDEIDHDYLKDEIEHLLVGIEEGAKRTGTIVEGLRTFSRLDNSSFQEYALVDGIESTLTLLNSQLTSHHIKVVKDYEPGLTVACLPDRINQVFMNILSNAIDALKNKTGERIVSITLKSDPSHVTIKIADNGTGMDEITKNKIFDPFFTTKDVGSGTGLGLSITYGIIKDHHGQIEVDSVVNQGTIFTIKLPMRSIGTA